MSKELFNRLVKIGNKKPELQEDITPVLHHLKESQMEKSGSIKKAIRRAQSLICDKIEEKLEEIPHLMVDLGKKRGSKIELTEINSYGGSNVLFFGDELEGEIILRDVDMREEMLVLEINMKYKGRSNSFEGKVISQATWIKEQLEDMIREVS